MARAAALVLFAAGALIIDIPLSLIAGRPAHQPAAAVPAVKKSCKQGHRFGIVRSASFGFQNPSGLPDVLDAAQYAELVREADKNMGRGINTTFTEEDVARFRREGGMIWL